MADVDTTRSSRLERIVFVMAGVIFVLCFFAIVDQSILVDRELAKTRAIADQVRAITDAARQQHR